MKEKKKHGTASSKALKLLTLLCVLVFLFSLVQVIKIWSAYREAENFYEDAAEKYTQSLGAAGLSGAGGGAGQAGPPVSADLDALIEKNEDIIGWIYMEDTVVSYPLLQGPNNYYYLDKTYEKKYLASGSIYLDTENSPDFSDAHSIIFGHNMKNHTMFGDLDMFEDGEYLQEHPYVYLLLPEGRWLKYQIFSVYRAGVEDGTYEVPLNEEEDFAKFLQLTLDKNLHDSDNLGLPVPTTEDKVITLSTCTEDSAQLERFVLQAVLVESGE